MADHVVRMIQNPRERSWRGEAARKAVTNGCGVAARTVECLIERSVI